MNRKLAASIAAAFLIIFPAFSQQKMDPESVRLLKEDITRAGVNTNSYETPVIQDTKVPKGYKPFYISHYGRHGSRNNWGRKYYKRLVKRLSEAKEAGILSRSGDSLLSEATKIRNIELQGGANGRLTPRGVREHDGIAERMFHRYPAVFKKGNHIIRVVSSTTPRCIVSMAAFTNSLKGLEPSLDISLASDEDIMEYISSSCTEEVKEASQKMLDSLDAAVPVDTTGVLERLFTDPVKARKIIGGNVAAFEKDIFRTARVADPFDVSDNLFRFIPFGATYKWYDLDNREIYLRQCYSAEFGKERLPLVQSLVDDFVTKADEAIDRGTVAADLRFGHDWPTMALAGYLGIERLGEPYSFDEIPAHFFGGLDVPLACNIQLIFYRNRSGNVIVKCLLNEKETTIPGLDSVSGPYYDWNELKTWLKKRI